VRLRDSAQAGTRQRCGMVDGSVSPRVVCDTAGAIGTTGTGRIENKRLVLR
jgi:hypothetical protein